MARPSLETMQKLLEHPLRLAILTGLHAGRMKTTRELADLTGAGPGTLRHHLARLREADVIILHVPLTKKTQNMIGYSELKKMKPDACIINVSRGGIVNESDLERVLNEGHLSGAAIDVFENEPYTGGLCKIERCLLTSHMGSMSVDCRTKMEIEATEEVVRFFQKKSLQGLVPTSEYDIQEQNL